MVLWFYYYLLMFFFLFSYLPLASTEGGHVPLLWEGSILKVEAFEVLEAFERRAYKGIHLPSVFFRRPSGAACPVYESADAVHLQQVVLILRGDVLVDFWKDLGSYAPLDGFQQTEAEGDGRFPHADDVVGLHRPRGLHVHPVYCHSSVLTGVSGVGAGLEDAGSPEPLVQAGNKPTPFPSRREGGLNRPVDGETQTL